ncbi:methyltransferase [Trichothermofontia sp.]
MNPSYTIVDSTVVAENLGISLENREIITYDPNQTTDYQHLVPGSILHLKFESSIAPIFLETHPGVWAPTAFTTEMCQLILADDCRGKRVLDFAAGSGILGIAAAIQGASQVIFTDLNPQAIVMACRNWHLNQLPAEQATFLESNCFEAAYPYLAQTGKVDRIYSNPPTFPGTREFFQKLLADRDQHPAADWNHNGRWGRFVTDVLITEGRNLLNPSGEILFVTTSKQGARKTQQLMDQYWGPGMVSDQADPLDYCHPWSERGEANWAVVHRLDLPLADYYWEFLPLYKEMATSLGEAEPVVEKEGVLYQKLYFIRAVNNSVQHG